VIMEAGRARRASVTDVTRVTPNSSQRGLLGVSGRPGPGANDMGARSAVAGTTADRAPMSLGCLPTAIAGRSRRPTSRDHVCLQGQGPAGLGGTPIGSTAALEGARHSCGNAEAGPVARQGAPAPDPWLPANPAAADPILA